MDHRRRGNPRIDKHYMQPMGDNSLIRHLQIRTGSKVRVRRSSDNSETDIGFTENGNLDTAALLTFVVAGNGFVIINSQ